MTTPRRPKQERDLAIEHVRVPLVNGTPSRVTRVRSAVSLFQALREDSREDDHRRPDHDAHTQGRSCD